MKGLDDLLLAGLEPDVLFAEDFIEQYVTAQKTYAGPKAQEASYFQTGEYLLSQKFPDIKWAVPGIFPEGLTVVCGKHKIGKSWLLLDTAIGIATGTPVWGDLPVPVGDVLFLALEDSSRAFQQRLYNVVGWRENPSITLDFFRYADRNTNVLRSDKGGLDKLKEWCERHERRALVVIDPKILFEPMPDKRNQQQGSYAAEYDMLNRIRDVAHEYKVGIILSHHTRKGDADDAFDLMLGSTAIPAAADCNAILKRDRHSRVATLDVIGKEVSEKKYCLDWEPDLCRYTLVGEKEDKPTAAMETEAWLLDLLGRKAQVFNPDLDRMAEENGHSKYVLSKLKTSLTKQGKIKRTAGGKGRPFSWSLV